MKKLLLIVMLFSLVGCTNDDFKEEKQVYNNYINELKSTSKKSFDNYLPFDIKLYYDKIVETEVMYRVIIDNPKVAIRNIEAVAIHNKQTFDMFPTSGIFDEKYSLIPNVINKKSNYVEGIILVGYIPFDYDIKKFEAEFKVLIKYEDDEENIKKVYYLSKTDNLVDSFD